MTDVRCVVCEAETRHEDTVMTDLTDVTCPACGVMSRYVGVPMFVRDEHGVEIIGRPA